METYRICVTHFGYAAKNIKNNLNLNLIKKIYLEIPNKLFISKYSNLFGEISQEGITNLVTTNSDTIVLSANLVVISQGIIYNCTKKRVIDYYDYRPPPPCYPPPRLNKNKHKKSSKPNITTIDLKNNKLGKFSIESSV